MRRRPPISKRTDTLFPYTTRFRSGSTGDYIAVKHGRQKVEHLHPLVDELTWYSQYQIIYQEQILALCRNVGKFPWVHAAEIRKVISQKKGEAAFNRLYGQFLEGAQSQGIEDALADKIWKKLEIGRAHV